MSVETWKWETVYGKNRGFKSSEYIRIYIYEGREREYSMWQGLSKVGQGKLEGTVMGKRDN